MRNNITLTLKLTLEKKTNIGAGGLALKVQSDIPFKNIRINDKIVKIIPGSTIKGLLRTGLIRISNLLGYSDVTKSVNPSIVKYRGKDIVTKLFGRPHDISSKVIVEPAFIERKGFTLTHVRINDRIGTAEERGLFTREYMPIGEQVKVRIDGFGLDLEEARALLLSVVELNYEKIGKSGCVNVKIIKEESEFPPEFLGDPVIKEILEVIGE